VPPPGAKIAARRRRITPQQILCEIPRTQNIALANSTPKICLLRGPTIGPNAEQNPAWGKGSSKMTTWRYQLFVVSVGARAGADVLGHQGLEDELNDLGQQGWELTAVTDAGDAKIFILKQPDEITLDPLAQA
jgi:hypothetical protein